MMRVDYRYLRLASVPMYVVAIALLVLVFVPALNIEVGGSARWLKLPLLPAVHPAEFAKLALVIYLAHWFAKRGAPDQGFLERHGPVPRHRRAGHRARLQGAGPRHDRRHHADGVHDVLRRRREPRPSRGHGRRSARRARDGRPARLPARPYPGVAEPLARSARATATTPSRGCSRWASADSSGRVSAAARVFVPNAFNDFIFAEVGQEFGIVGALVVIGLFLILGLLRHPRRARGAGYLRSAARHRDHRMAVPAGVHQHRRGRGPAADHRHHAAVHQRRRLIPHHQLRGGRDPALDIARDGRQEDVERRCDC